ncbi:MAG: carbon-nitrogen hydrolase family protein [Bacteroidetes bacterium]|nr:carbon-nitrogen hydrolase family protein [Bacteroidota bacterium]
MKIALVQQKASVNLELNRQKGVNSVIEAASSGAKIICFAELAFTPFFPQKPSDKNFIDHSETVPGSTTDVFCKLAKELEVVIVLNLYERDGNKTYDSSPVIDADGKIMGTTRMIHITDYSCFHEKDYYTPGNNGAPVYDTKHGKIGIAICYDRHYPEYMRTLALNGAEIVFVPQAGAVGEWPEGLYESEMRVAAFQNGYFTALCNRVGEEECLTFSGESFVSNPEGEIIARACLGKEEILFCDIDLSDCGKSHAKRLFMRDRRPELYIDWFNNK